MIEVLIAALAAAAIGTATGVAVRRRRRRLAREEAARAERPQRCVELGELEPGDVVAYLGSTYLVEGVAELDEGAGTSVVVARTAGDDGCRYLVVELAPAAAPVLAEPRGPVGAGGTPPSWLVEEGLEWGLVRRATARVTARGELEGLAPGPCQLGRYEGPGGRVGYVLVSGGQELVLAGRSVTVEGLVLMQGGDVGRPG